MLTKQDTMDILKGYSKFKKQLSKQLGYGEIKVQRAIDDLVTYAIANDGVTDEQLITLATPEDSLLHDIFNWEENAEYRIAQAQGLLSMLTYAVTSDDKIYQLGIEV